MKIFRIDLDWQEEGLEGVIPEVPVYVDEDGAVIAFPHEASKVIGQWRAREIEMRGDDEKRSQMDRIRAQTQALREHLRVLERLGLCHAQGDLVEERLECLDAFELEGNLDWDKLYAMDHHTTSSS